MDMALKYSRYVDVRKALAQHDQFDPLDRLYRGQNHDRRGYGWDWPKHGLPAENIGLQSRGRSGFHA